MANFTIPSNSSHYQNITSASNLTIAVVQEFINSTLPVKTFGYNSTMNESDPPLEDMLEPQGSFGYFSIIHRVVASSILIIIILISVIGNTLVIMAFCRIRSLRSVTNYFIVSLSVADILVALGTMPIWTYHLIKGSREIMFEDRLYYFWLFLDIGCGTASITNLTVISVERYFCISRPFSYHQNVTTKKALIAITTTSVYSLLMASFGVLFTQTVTDLRVYTIVNPCLTFFLPLLIMGFSYQQIFSVAKYQMKKIEMTIHGKTKKFRLSREIRAAKVLAVVMGAFLICWGPFLMANWYAINNWEASYLPEVVSYTKCLHYFNSCLNPIIYACLNREFRNAFKKLLGLKKRPSDKKTSETGNTKMAEYSLTPSSDEKL